ncbi:hypothetical protein C8J57DRAFT_1232916 [Mycena rebaudengoi]|nr:hypothetical protein C8J57DRAFT_1232916 [Mycena rebaudengoi]
MLKPDGLPSTVGVKPHGFHVKLHGSFAWKASTKRFHDGYASEPAHRAALHASSPPSDSIRVHHPLPHCPAHRRRSPINHRCCRSSERVEIGRDDAAGMVQQTESGEETGRGKFSGNPVIYSGFMKQIHQNLWKSCHILWISYPIWLQWVQGMGTVQFRGYVKDPVEVTGCEGLPLKSTVCIVESQWSSVTQTGFAGPRILLGFCAFQLRYSARRAFDKLVATIMPLPSGLRLCPALQLLSLGTGPTRYEGPSSTHSSGFVFAVVLFLKASLAPR